MDNNWKKEVKIIKIQKGKYCDNMSLLFECRNESDELVVKEEACDKIFESLLIKYNTIACVPVDIDLEKLKNLTEFMENDSNYTIRPKNIEGDVNVVFFKIDDFDNLENFQLFLFKNKIPAKIYSTLSEKIYITVNWPDNLLKFDK